MSFNRTLQHTFAADGNSAAISWSGTHIGHFYSQGTFGGGTSTLQYSVDGGATYVAVDSTNLAFTADGAGNFELPSCLLRVNLNGSTSPDLSVGIRSIGRGSY